MSRRLLYALALVAAAVASGQQEAESKAPLADLPKIDIKGKIERVALSRGQGMPSIYVKSEDGAATQVVLGSMRYLMEQDFNPKAGEEVKVTGYKLNDYVAAITVVLPDGKVVRLRDENGRPAWIGGHRGASGGGRGHRR